MSAYYALGLRILTHHHSPLTISVNILLGLTLIGCGASRVADVKYPCRSNVDCAVQGERCLPMYKGDTLSDYCQVAPCPSLDGFDRFSGERAMVKLCGVDLDEDGLVDLGGHRPPAASEVGDYQDDRLFDDYSNGDVIEDALFIPSLFQNGECAIGLEDVEELGICLTPPRSVVFCDQDSDCDAESYCNSGLATCQPKIRVGGDCSRSGVCSSGQCESEYCVDGAIGSRCEVDSACESGLTCLGQQSAAPGFSPTSGITACGDPAQPFSPCDPALNPCEGGLTCEQMNFSGYTDCEDQTVSSGGERATCGEVTGCLEVCDRLKGERLFICMP